MNLQIECLKLKTKAVNVNCCVIYEQSSKSAIVVDPAGECDKLCAFLKEKKLSLKYIVLTHGHLDHTMCTAELKSKTGAAVCMNAGDEIIVRDPEKNAARIIGIENTADFKIDIYATDGMTLNIGSEEVTIIETPGHTPGSISLYCQGNLICGDAILAGGLGRTDLFAADMNRACHTVIDKIFSLPDNTVLYCGHGEPTSVAAEKTGNEMIKAFAERNGYER